MRRVHGAQDGFYWCWCWCEATPTRSRTALGAKGLIGAKQHVVHVFIGDPCLRDASHGRPKVVHATRSSKGWFADRRLKPLQKMEMSLILAQNER